MERPITIDEVLKANENNKLEEIFGTGTAAVISPVGELYYKGQTISINNGKTGPLAQRLFDELEAIQYAHQDDPYDWMEKLN